MKETQNYGYESKVPESFNAIKDIWAPVRISYFYYTFSTVMTELCMVNLTQSFSYEKYIIHNACILFTWELHLWA